MNFLLHVYKKKKKRLQEKQRQVGFSGPGRRTVLKVLQVSFSPLQMIKYWVITPSDPQGEWQSRSSKLLKMTLILSYGDTTMEHGKIPFNLMQFQYQPKTHLGRTCPLVSLGPPWVGPAMTSTFTHWSSQSSLLLQSLPAASHQLPIKKMTSPKIRKNIILKFLQDLSSG